MEFFTSLLTVENAIALFTLTSLEIVLGIDNIVFIAILTGKLPPERRATARQTGLLAAMGMRILLLFGITWIMKLKATLFTIAGHDFSGKDLIILLGGLFLVAKATYEIHDKLEGPPHETAARAAASFGRVIAQIMMVDIVFSIDSVITAIGMVQSLPVMVTAVVISVLVMLAAAGPISSFIERHPTFKILALSFLLLIGVMLIVEGSGGHIAKGYIYFAMGFAFGVELLNLRYRTIQTKAHSAAGA